MAALPTVAVEAAVGQGAGNDRATLTWTDITDYVRAVDGLRFARGRGQVDAQPVSGTLAVTLDNTDGRFTPGRAGGPYSGGFRARIPLRVTVAGLAGASSPWAAEWAPAEYGPTALGATPLWTGFITDIDAVVAGEPRVLVQAADTVSRAAKMVCRPWTKSRTAAGCAPLLGYWPCDDTDSPDAPKPAAGPPLVRSTANQGYVGDPLHAFVAGGLDADGGNVLSMSPDVQWVAGLLMSSHHVWTSPTIVRGSSTANLILAAWVRLDPSIPPNAIPGYGLQILAQWATPVETVTPLGDIEYYELSLWLTEHEPTSAVGPASLSATWDTVYSDEWTGQYWTAAAGLPLRWGQWHHVAATIDYSGGAGTLRLWVDGVAGGATVGTVATTGLLPSGALRVNGNHTIGMTGWTAHWLAAEPADTAAAVAVAADDGRNHPTAAARTTTLADTTTSPDATRSWLTADTAALKPIAAQATGKRYLLDLLTEVAAVERGTLHAQRDGRIRLASARSRLTDTVALTLSATSAVLELQGAFGVDDAEAVDEATVTTADGTAFTGTRIGGTGLESTSLTLATDDRVHAQSTADGIANHPADEVRAPTLTLSIGKLAADNPVDAATATLIDVGDRIRVTDLDTTWAPAATLDLIVDRVAHDIAKDGWRITLDTSPGATAVGAVVGTAGTLSTVATTLKIRPA